MPVGAGRRCAGRNRPPAFPPAPATPPYRRLSAARVSPRLRSWLFFWPPRSRRCHNGNNFFVVDLFNSVVEEVLLLSDRTQRANPRIPLRIIYVRWPRGPRTSPVGALRRPCRCRGQRASGWPPATKAPRRRRRSARPAAARRAAAAAPPCATSNRPSPPPAPRAPPAAAAGSPHGWSTRPRPRRRGRRVAGERRPSGGTPRRTRRSDGARHVPASRGKAAAGDDDGVAGGDFGSLLQEGRNRVGRNAEADEGVDGGRVHRAPAPTATTARGRNRVIGRFSSACRSIRSFNLRGMLACV